MYEYLNVQKKFGIFVLKGLSNFWGLFGPLKGGLIFETFLKNNLCQGL